MIVPNWRRRFAAAATALIVAGLLAACGTNAGTSGTSSTTSSTPASGTSQDDVTGIIAAQRAWAASGVSGATAIARDLRRIAVAIRHGDPALFDDANGTLSLDVGEADMNSVPPNVARALRYTSTASLDLGQADLTGLPVANSWLLKAARALNSSTALPAPSPSASVSPALDRRLVAWDKHNLGYANSPPEPSLYDDSSVWAGQVNDLLDSLAFSMPQGSNSPLTAGSVINNDGQWAGSTGDSVRYYDGDVQLGGGLKKTKMILRFSFVTDSLGHSHLLVAVLHRVPPGVTFTGA